MASVVVEASSSCRSTKVTTQEVKSTVDKKLVEVRGKILKFCSNGEVLVSFLEKCNEIKNSSFILVQLDGLEFYMGTDVLISLSSFVNCDWLLNEEFLMQLDPLSFVTPKQGSAKKKMVKLYRNYPHGRVDINIQIRNRLWQMFQSEMKLEMEPKQAKFLRCDAWGNVWFQLCTRITDRILEYSKNNDFSTPRPETRDTLLKARVSNEIYVTRNALRPRRDHDHDLLTVNVTPYRNEGGLYRIKIRKLVSSEVVRVEYIDFMELQEIPIKNNIFKAGKIDENFARLPSLCLQGHLKGIASVDIRRVFPVKLDEIIQVRLTCPELPKNVFGRSLVPDVYVDFKKCGKWLDLNYFLVDDFLGVAEVPEGCHNICGVLYDEDEDRPD